MDVMAAEISTEVQGFWEGEVGEILISEGDNFTLGDEEGELVFAGPAQFAELDAGYFGADAWSEFLDRASFR